MDVLSGQAIKLDLGAGDKINPGFIRVGLQAEHDIVCDLRNIPLPDDYADEAMAIHVFEHFHFWDALPVLQEWRRVLKPGGTLILELPDLYKCCRAYLKDLGARERNSLWGIYGDPKHKDELMLHKWGWTPQTLMPLLREAGFIKIKSKNPQFHAGRLERDMRLEARKPGA